MSEKEFKYLMDNKILNIGDELTLNTIEGIRFKILDDKTNVKIIYFNYQLLRKTLLENSNEGNVNELNVDKNIDDTLKILSGKISLLITKLRKWMSVQFSVHVCFKYKGQTRTLKEIYDMIYSEEVNKNNQKEYKKNKELENKSYINDSENRRLKEEILKAISDLRTELKADIDTVKKDLENKMTQSRKT